MLRLVHSKHAIVLLLRTFIVLISCKFVENYIGVFFQILEGYKIFPRNFTLIWYCFFIFNFTVTFSLIVYQFRWITSSSFSIKKFWCNFIFVFSSNENSLIILKIFRTGWVFDLHISEPQISDVKRITFFPSL